MSRLAVCRVSLEEEGTKLPGSRASISHVLHSTQRSLWLEPYDLHPFPSAVALQTLGAFHAVPCISRGPNYTAHFWAILTYEEIDPMEDAVL